MVGSAGDVLGATTRHSAEECRLFVSADNEV